MTWLTDMLYIKSFAGKQEFLVIIMPIDDENTKNHSQKVT